MNIFIDDGAPIGLDSYTSGLWATYGLNKMLSSYSGSAVRVRRSNDNAEQDIGFSGNSFDSASLASFVGANSAFVTTWYDQTGNSRDMLQATAGRQPRIVNAGTPDGKIVFNPSGSDDFLQTSATGSSSVAAHSIFRRVLARSKTGNHIEWEYGDGALIGSGSGANQQQLNNTASPGNAIYIATNASGSGYREVIYVTGASESVLGSIGMISLKGQTLGNTFKVYAGGALLTPNSSNDVGSVTVTGNWPAYPWSLGARASSANLGALIDMYCCAIYDADKSTDALAINAILDAL